MWNVAVILAIGFLVSCAAYKVGTMKAEYIADQKVEELVQENNKLRANNINLNWQVNQFHDDFNLLMIGSQYGFPPDGWNEKRQDAYMKKFRSAEARHREYMEKKYKNNENEGKF